MNGQFFRSRTKQLRSLAVLGAVACGSVVGVPNFSHADDVQNRGYDGRYDANLLTIRGTVTRNLTGNQFEMRSDAGRTFRVTSDDTGPYRLAIGDRVEVRGSFNNDIFTARDVRIVQDEDELTTVTGQVTRDLAGQGFEMRSDDGRTFRVVPHDAEPRRLSIGDRVEVRGHLDGNIFIAHDIYVTNDDSIPTFTGTVTRDLPGEEFEMRTIQGQTFRVIVRYTEPQGLSNGARVEVHGRIDGNLLIAETVRIVRDEDDYNATTLRGTVAHDPDNNQFWLRLDNGAAMRIIMQTTAPAGLSAGDRVEVRGRAQNGAFSASSVRILGDADYRDDYRSVNFPATILAKPSADRLTVRGDNGRTYEIRTRTNITALKVGDHIRIIGHATQNAVQADQIINLPDTYRSSQAINLTGTIISIDRVLGTSGFLQVRGDNGIQHRVRWNNVSDFRTGQRVRIVGTSDENTVNATNITRL